MLPLLIVLLSFPLLQLMEGVDGTEESNKRAVRKRRVRKDWGGGWHAYCLQSPQVGMRWKGRICCSPSPSGTACVSSKPPGSLQSPRLPLPCLLNPSATLLTGPAVSPEHILYQTLSLVLSLPSCLLIRLSNESPGDFVHLAVFHSSILRLQALFILLSLSKPLPVNHNRSKTSTCIFSPRLCCLSENMTS